MTTVTRAQRGSALTVSTESCFCEDVSCVCSVQAESEHDAAQGQGHKERQRAMRSRMLPQTDQCAQCTLCHVLQIQCKCTACCQLSSRGSHNRLYKFSSDDQECITRSWTFEGETLDFDMIGQILIALNFRLSEIGERGRCRLGEGRLAGTRGAGRVPGTRRASRPSPETEIRQQRRLDVQRGLREEYGCR